MLDIFKINLQLFAEPNTNVTTDAGLSVENQTHYDMTLIDEAGPQLVHDQFAQKRPIPKNGGKKINFRKFAALPKATQPLTEGVTPNGKKLSATAIEAEVSQYGDYVVMSDVLDLTALDPIIVEATKVCGRQAGLTLDTITRNILHSGTNVYYAPKADGTVIESRATLDATCKLTVDVVRRVAAILKKNNAPKIDGSYAAIIHPFAAYDLMSDPEWKYPHQYKDTDNIYEGEIGKIGGVRFVETSEAKIYEGGVFGTLFIADGAYGTTEITGGGLRTIIKPLGSAGSADPLDQRSSVGWKASKTAEILVPAYLIRVEHESSFSDEVEAN
ncbi:MAG: N4-gp56 family major capsid protein [Clostridia bacterium]|nr:N4-gp56 family major capsid protein [Clostridia bacterium]